MGWQSYTANGIAICIKHVVYVANQSGMAKVPTEQ
jgi:hypothetical protein